MEAWQERVIDEQSSLESKITKLKVFLNSPFFHSIPNKHQFLLKIQLDSMKMYEAILSQRIALFNIEVKSGG